jgi:hypothetical protein
MRTFIEKN